PVSLPFYVLTRDFHHSILGFHHQLLGREVVDIQGHLPVVLGLLDLRHAGAQLAGQGVGLLGHHGARVHHGGVGHHAAHVRGQHGGPQVSRPMGAWECGKVLWQGRQAEGLVEQAAVLVPVAEWVPARGAKQGEGNTSLGHGCCLGGR
uniref:Uncharacterized protein n=1 Tax=Scophthalmus maximus TaxID=52904 RepID=A0A8D2ZE50_SCOMX